ncbi:MAG TPA: flagellar hook-length control protein FliK [Rhodanobacteraceae bacterium]|nr:flagellar hook-length control protein FliK [Oleiagrimonas sp.]HET9819558.1 flagellar hook-length control protein FliK [Rhodanobacteraceae bacterium]
MSVPPIQLATLDWVAAAAGTLPRPWPVGSVVSGRVLELIEGTRLILQINGQTVEADPPSNGPVPHNFQARVLSNGPQPLLELLGQPGKSTATAAALRARLPHQGGLQPLLADMHALAGTPGARSLPEPVRAALARLEASITDRHDILDPDVLRDTVRRAGTQLEHTLLQHVRTPARLPATQIDYDLKAALQRLAQALQPLPQARVSTAPAGAETPPPLLDLPLRPQARLPAPPAADALTMATGMLKHVQAAMSRIEIMQLEAHPSASPQACMFEVPVRGDDGFDVLQIRIEQDAPANPGMNPPQWTLGFTLELPSLGAIHGQIRLRRVKVDVDLWAQHDGAVHALEEQTSVLARLLESSGLQLVQLRVRQGTPLRHTGLARRLLEASA